MFCLLFAPVTQAPSSLPSVCPVLVTPAEALPAAEGAPFAALFCFAILCGPTRFPGATPCWEGKIAWCVRADHPVRATLDIVVLQLRDFEPCMDPFEKNVYVNKSILSGVPFCFERLVFLKRVWSDW